MHVGPYFFYISQSIFAEISSHASSNTKEKNSMHSNDAEVNVVSLYGDPATFSAPSGPKNFTFYFDITTPWVMVKIELTGCPVQLRVSRSECYCITHRTVVSFFFLILLRPARIIRDSLEGRARYKYSENATGMPSFRGLTSSFRSYVISRLFRCSTDQFPRVSRASYTRIQIFINTKSMFSETFCILQNIAPSRHSRGTCTICANCTNNRISTANNSQPIKNKVQRLNSKMKLKNWIEK